MAAIDPARSAQDREQAYSVLEHDINGWDDDAFAGANDAIFAVIQSVIEEPEGPVDVAGALRLVELAQLDFTAKDFEFTS